MNGTISYGVVTAGVFGVHDLNVTEFSLFVNLDADIQGMLDIGVNLTVRTACCGLVVSLSEGMFFS